MDILTLARRANLGYTINTRYQNVGEQIKAGRAYRELIKTSLSLSEEQQMFHESAYLIRLISSLEAYVHDAAVEYLFRFPGHIKDKSITLDVLATSGSVGGSIGKMVEREINSWSYKRFYEFANYAISLYNKKSSFDPDLLGRVTEIKATRDIFVHANGRVNSVYFEKSGANARTPDGKSLTLGADYLDAAEASVVEFINAFHSAIPDKIKKMGRVAAFKAMWEATYLSKHVPFSQGWIVSEQSDMVRPNDEGLEWAWSGSEKMLLDFFLGIYSKDYPSRQHDLMEAINRWSPATNEGKVILSWFDSPFWF